VLVFKTLGSITLSSLLIAAGGPSKCFQKQEPASQSKLPTVVETEKPARSQMKVLAEGLHSAIANPFVAVVRDSGTYQELRRLEGSLPKLDVDFFETNVVVGAFLGERNTGGYAVKITEEVSGQIHVAEKKPGKGVMVPQMITAPFKIVAINNSPNSRVSLSLDEAWQKRAQSYLVTRGSFGFSGGFAGSGKTFALKGRVLILRENKLATLLFDLFSSDSARQRSLIDSASTVVDDDGRISTARIGAGSLVPPPNGGLQAHGLFSDKGKKIWLEFSSRLVNVSDSYSGNGSIEAESGDGKGP
jgi:hypothetical protein